MIKVWMKKNFKIFYTIKITQLILFFTKIFFHFFISLRTFAQKKKIENFFVFNKKDISSIGYSITPENAIYFQPPK
jgi:hypothetical protein